MSLINSREVRTRFFASYDYTTPTSTPLRGLITRFGTGNDSQDANGLHFDNTVGTQAGVFTGGGFSAWLATVTMRFEAPTVAGTEDMGFAIDCHGFEDQSDMLAIIRIRNGTAELVTRIGDGATTPTNIIDAQAFALPQAELVTITAERHGDIVTASLSSATPGTVQLSGSIAGVDSGGSFGWYATDTSFTITTRTIQELAS